MNHITVVIPAYNRSDVIGETLDSLIAQSRKPDEIIVVDDGSRDNTAGTVRDWIKAHGEVSCRLHVMAANAGKPAAVNAGISLAGGSLFVILDSDDVLLPDALQVQTEFMESRPECGMVFGLAYEMHGTVRTQRLAGGFGIDRILPDVRTLTGDLLLRVNPIVASSVMFRRSAWEAVGPMNPLLRHVQDWDLWIRIGRKFAVGFVPRPLVYYRMNSANSLTGNRVGMFREVASLVEGDTHTSRTERLMAAMRHTRFNAGTAMKHGHLRDAISMIGIAGKTVGRILLS